MGAGASTPFENQEATPEAAVSALGVKLSFLQEFYTNCCKGKENVENKTTFEVFEEFIQPLTRQFQLSFVEILSKMQHPAVGKADVYICHSWGYKFVPFIEQLQSYYANSNPNVVVWLDIFSFNSWIVQPPDSHWSIMIKSQIDQIGKCLFVLLPWDNVTVWSRTWILYELYCTFITGNEFDVAITPADSDGLIDDISGDCEVMDGILSTINVESSETTLDGDKENILKVLQYVEDDLENVNSLICQKVRDWLISLAKKELNKQEAMKNTNVTEIQKQLKLMFGLGNIYAAQANLDIAESIHSECYSKRKEALGEKHADTLESMGNLGQILESQGKVDIAEELLDQALTMKCEVYGKQHSITLSAMQNLASLYQQGKKYDAAEQLYQEIYETNLALNTEKHASTLKALNNLAILYDEQGLHEKAIPLYLQCITLSEELNGKTHLLTILLMSNVASLYFSSEKYDLAIPLYQDCIERNKEVYGEAHPDTFQSMNNLAMVYESKEENEKALEIYHECVEICRRRLGDDDPSTLKALNNLASYYFNQGDFQAAESFYQICLEKSALIYGDSHPFTIVLKENIQLLEKEKNPHSGDGKEAE